MCVYCLILGTAWTIVVDKNIQVNHTQEEKWHSGYTHLGGDFVVRASDFRCLWKSTLWKIWPGARTQWSWRRMPSRELTSWGFSAGITCPRNCWWSYCCIDLLSVWVWSSSCRPEQRKVLQGVIKVAQKRPGCLHPTQWGASALNTNTDWKEFQPHSYQYIEIRCLWCVFLA